MKNLLKDFLYDLITVSFGLAVAFFLFYLLNGCYHFMSKHENNTKTVDTVYVHTVYVHDTIFIERQ